MSTLKVTGAEIYYETVGQGPMLLCISGADGSCEIWRGFAENMKDRFTVVMWDRRGFSRSYLNGPQDYDRRLETDVEDAASLIKHISPNQPATVIGNSSGAIIALKFLTMHPELVRTLVSYEPPAAKVLPEYPAIWQKHEETYALYRKSGPWPALASFAELTKADQRMIAGVFDFKDRPNMWSNLQYWFEREFMFYPNADFDVEKDFKPLKEKLVFVNGVDSPKEAYQYRANLVMSEQLGVSLSILPGEHVAHATHPKEFSQKLWEVLKERGY